METKMVVKEMRLTSEVLDIIHHQDEFTTSDLQGAIQSVIMSAIRFGIELQKQKESEQENGK